MRLNLKTMRTSEETSRIKAILRAERDRNASAPFIYDAKLAFLEDPETDPFDFCYAYASQIRNIGAEDQFVSSGGGNSYFGERSGEALAF